MAVERFWEPLNHDVKVVILRSEGENVFSSGHDLNEIRWTLLSQRSLIFKKPPTGSLF